MARGRAPGLKREFGFEKLDTFNGSLWKKLREEASQPAQKSPKLQLFGSDSDAKALNVARRNLAAAGVERWVKLEASDVLSRKAPAESGVMIANPPYGERIGESEELARFYPKLGDALKKNFAGWNCYFSCRPQDGEDDAAFDLAANAALHGALSAVVRVQDRGGESPGLAVDRSFLRVL